MGATIRLAGDQPLPLTGIRVLDLGQVYLGPYAGFLMAEAGAEVIKVEPVGGEPNRARAEINPGALLPFEMLNANKKGIALNVKSDEGREALIELVRHCDVLIENFAPGALERCGLGPDTLLAINPRLIYASGTGFGLAGPDRDGLAMDITIQAVSGIMSTTGPESGQPYKAGPAVVDFGAGAHLYAAIVTALVGRGVTGKGRLVEVAMQEVVYPSLASTLGMIFGREPGDVPLRTGNRHSGLALAPYNVYATSDGHVGIIVIQDRHWESLLTAMGRLDLVDDTRFSTNAARVRNMAETDALVESWTSRHTMKEVFALAREHRVACAPVRSVFDIVKDPHMHERGMLEWVDSPRLGKAVLNRSPLRFHDSDPRPLICAPELGEHTHDVLKGIAGYSDDDIRRLAEAGIVRIAGEAGGAAR